MLMRTFGGENRGKRGLTAPRRHNPAGLVGYLIALLVVVLAVLARLPLSPILGDRRPYLTLFGAVALAAWLARWRPATLAAIVGFILANRLFTSAADPEAGRVTFLFAEFIVYAISAGMIIYLGERLHRARDNAERRAMQLIVSEDAERERSALLRVTLASIGDAVITTDAHGRVTALNPVAEALTGWSHVEAANQPLENVFQIVNEQTRKPADNPAIRALRDGLVVGLANHTVLLSKDGRERPVDDSAAPIRNEHGDLLGCVLVFRDVTERRRAEKEILESREMLRITLASIGDGVIVTDARGTVRSLNAEAERLTEWTSDDASGKPLSEVFHIVNENTGKIVENPVEIVIREGTVVGMANHTVLISKTGRRIPIDDSAAPIREREGPLFGVVLVFRDVEEQRALQRAQAHLAAIVKYSGDAIVTKDLNGIVQTWNASAEALFGYRPEEIIGKSITTLLPPERLQEETEILARLRRGQPFERLETVRLTKEGRRLNVSVSISPLLDADGKVTGASKVVHDITDRKIAEEALRESEQRFRRMADAAPVLIWTSGIDKRYTWFNKQWLDFVGRPMEKEIGHGWAENVHPDDYNHCRETYVTKFDGREPFTMMYRLRRHDGEHRWLFDHGIPLYDARGDFAGYIGSCIDITERRNAEDSLREADRRKDEFIAVLSHELRNPLAPIAMVVDVMRQKPVSDPRERQLRGILERSTAQLARLLDDLLDVNRIRSGKIVLRKEHLKLNDAVAHAVESTRPQIDARGQSLAVSLPRDPVYVDADATRMAQVIANLLCNASKYTGPRGNIALTLVHQDGRAILSVRDSGIGIHPEQMSRIFDMFAQVHSSLDREHSGLGVGLALTRTLVELHGGHIEVRSEGPGKGSEFIVRLPAAESKPEPAVEQSVEPARNARPARKVLVADDNVDSAEMLTTALRLAGHDVAMAHDGVATVEMAKSFAPEVALLDIGMPRMNGYEAAKNLRELFGASITLVAITGWGQDADRRRAEEAGFDHHLTKPVSLEAVERLLNSTDDNSAASA